MWTPLEQPLESAFFPTPHVLARGTDFATPLLPAIPQRRSRVPGQVAQGEIVTQGAGEGGFDCPNLAQPSVRVHDELRRYGRYHILKTLGVGGMGEVRLAYDPMLERRVALKTLRPQWSARRDSRDTRQTRLAQIERRLKREARSLAHLDHPNIVEVFDVGILRDQVYVAMKFVGGQNLRSWGECVAGQPRPWHEVAQLMLTVGRALASAHQQGVVHRDFKPDNVVVDEHDEPYVIDFGIALDEHESSEAHEEARAVSDSVDALASESGLHTRLTVHGNVVGTPAYMAPEQRLGNCDAAVDQYAFCVSLFEMVYGQRPFAGSSTTEEVRSAMRAPELPEARLQEMPRWLHRILLRGLSFEPSCRHASMVELCDALEVGLQSWRKRWWGRGFAGLMVAMAVMLGTTDVVTADMLIPEDPCPGMRHEWRGVWDEVQIAKIEAALLGTGLNYAAETWSLLRPRVDERVEGWLELRDEVCEETRVQGRASEDDLDVRMECLKLAKIRHGALLDVFARADEKVVEGALKAWSGLPSLEECRDSERLRDEVPWPEGPELRARVGELRGELAKVRAVSESGRIEDAERMLEALVAPIAELGFAALEAELALLLGSLARVGGDAKRAEREFERAVELGQVEGHRRVVADASIGLMFVQGYLLNDHASAWASAELAEASLEGLQQVGELRGNFLATLAILHGTSGRHEDALVLLRDAAERLRDDVGELHWAYHTTLGNLAVAHAFLGMSAKSVHIGARVMRLTEWTQGASHPSLALWYANQGLNLIIIGEVGKGLHYRRRAVAVCEAATRAPHASCSWYQQVLAFSLHRTGQIQESRALLKRADQAQRQFHRRGHPLESWAATGKAQSWLSTGHIEQSLESARLGWSQTSEDPSAAPYIKAGALLASASAELASGHRVVAREQIQQAVELVPEGSFDQGTRGWALKQLGILELQQGRPHRALELNNRALDFGTRFVGPESPRLAPSHLALARSHIALKNHTRALHHIHTALAMQHTMAITPNHTLTPYLAQLGRIHLAMQNPHKAQAAFQRGLELYDPEILHPRRRIELDEGFAQAQSALKQEAILIAQRGYINHKTPGPMPALAAPSPPEHWSRYFTARR